MVPGKTVREFVLVVAVFGPGSTPAIAQACYGAIDFGQGTSVQLQTAGDASWGPTTAATIAGGIAVGRGPLFGSIELGGGRFTDLDTQDHFFKATAGTHSTLGGQRRVTICPSYSYGRELTTQTYQGLLSSGAIQFLSVSHTVDLSVGFVATRRGDLFIIPFVQAGYSRAHDAVTNLIRAPDEIHDANASSYLAVGMGVVPNQRMSAAALMIFRSVEAPAEAFRTFQVRVAVALGHR